MIAPRAEPPLRGVIIREERDTLVVQATEQDVQRFARARGGPEVQVQPATLRVRLGGQLGSVATTAPPEAEVGRLRMGEPLYDGSGRPVAQLVSVDVSVDRYDVTSFGDMHRNYMGGLMRVDIRAVGLPGVTVG